MQDKTDLSLDEIIKSKKAANKKKNVGPKKIGGQGRNAGRNNNLRGTKGGRVNKQNIRTPTKGARRPRPLNNKVMIVNSSLVAKAVKGVRSFLSRNVLFM